MNKATIHGKHFHHETSFDVKKYLIILCFEWASFQDGLLFEMGLFSTLLLQTQKGSVFSRWASSEG